MAHKIMIMVGHGTDSQKKWDCGCTWNGYNEASLMLPITKSAVKYCRASGITVLSDADSGNNKNVITGVAWANKEKVELFMSIHCDYYKAPKGVYPLYYPTSAKGKKLATELNNAIKSGMNMTSRGIAGRSDLYELSQTDMPACILEVSSITDSIIRTKADEYGKCIAKGICKYLGVTFKDGTETQPVVPSTAKTVNYVVSVPKDKCVIRKGAGSSYAKVRTCPQGSYTIIKEQDGWGYLKSGEGWIYLAYTTKVVPKEKTTIEKFCDKLTELGNVIEKGWTYSNSNTATSWASAKKNKKSNCARFVSWAMQEVGMLPVGKVIWLNNKINSSGADYIKTSGRYKVTYPNKLPSKTWLKVGDICGWKTTAGQHTMVVMGFDASGHPLWASGGSGDMKSKMTKVRKTSYENRKVNCHIRYIGK